MDSRMRGKDERMKRPCRTIAKLGDTPVEAGDGPRRAERATFTSQGHGHSGEENILPSRWAQPGVDHGGEYSPKPPRRSLWTSSSQLLRLVNLRRAGECRASRGRTFRAIGKGVVV